MHNIKEYPTNHWSARLNLHETLTRIAEDFNLNADELIAYAEEDTLDNAYDGNPDTSPMGSVFGAEAKTLYALVRALKPQTLLELGSFRGVSASHIALALQANGSGVLVCVDMKRRMDLFPESLTPFIAFFERDGLEFVSQSSNEWDFVFEDMGHETDQVAHVWTNIRISKGGFLLSHDVCHAGVGKKVEAGIMQSGKGAFAYLTEPSDCGFAIWRNG